MPEKSAKETEDEKLLEQIMSPKEKIFFIPSEYLTMGLVALFIFLVLGGIIFLAAKTSSDSSNISIPMSSSSSLLTSPPPVNAAPAIITPQAPTGPILPATPKPTPTATPKPTATPTTIPTSSPTPTPSPTSASSSPSSDAMVKLSIGPNPTNATIANGSSITLNLNIDTGSGNVDAAELHLFFDQTKLQVVSVSAGTYLPVVLSTPAPLPYDSSVNTISISLGSSPGSTAHGPGTLATVVFKAIGTGTAPVRYDSSTKTASSGSNNLYSTSGSDITIN